MAEDLVAEDLVAEDLVAEDLVQPDSQRFAVLRECTENYDIGSSDAEWPNNLLSRLTVVFGSGEIARRGDPPAKSVDVQEVERCRALASAAHQEFGDGAIGMGSEADDGFLPFFICRQRSEGPATTITPELIRESFAGTIFPLATITAEPLIEAGIWWQEVQAWIEDEEEDEEDYDEEELAELEELRAERQSYLDAWRRLINWLSAQSDLSCPTFVRIGDSRDLSQLDSDQFPKGTEMTGSVLPRMAVALTPKGSLVGVFGHVVHT